MAVLLTHMREAGTTLLYDRSIDLRLRRAVVVRVLRQEVCEDKALPLNDLPKLHRDRIAEHRPVVSEGVELAPFAAGVDIRRQIGKELSIELPADERGRQLLRINASDAGTQTRINHFAYQFPRRTCPDREEGRNTRSPQAFLAVATDLFQKEIAECECVYCLG